MANRFRIAAVFGLLFTVASSAQAGLILNGSGHAIGVTDVFVAGTYYDVTFSVGSYNDAFGTEADPVPLPTFDGSVSGAFSAFEDIRDQLNAGSVSLVANALGATADSVIVPDAHTATSFNGYSTGAIAPLPWGSASIGGTRTFAGGGAGRTLSFALFTPAASAVPEPSSLALLAIGCCGLGGLRLRRKRQAST